MKAAIAIVAAASVPLSAARADGQEWPTPLAFSWEIQTRNQCVAQFRSFDWICGLLPTGEDYPKVYGRAFWDGAWISVAHEDLDDDGLEDVVFVLHHTGNCGSAGCAYSFVFGGQPMPATPRFYGIHARQHPALVVRDGERGIVFYPGSVFFPVSKIKEDAMDRIEYWNQRCSVDAC